MSSPAADLFRDVLTRCPLLDASAPLQPVAIGNRDRRVALTRWRTQARDGQPLLLTLGKGLADRAHRQADFARACPGLVLPPLACVPCGDQDMVVEPWVTGASLSDLTRSLPENIERIRRGLASVCDCLTQTEKNSTEEARALEWQQWASRTTGLGLWTPAERDLLCHRILPELYPLLTRQPPKLRWSNGDFTAGNLLYSQAGPTLLLDCEFARRTHFYREDAARFYALSPEARAHPDIFAGLLPRPGPAWHLFLWLRQIELESTHNTPAYFTSVKSARLALIRRLAETTMALDLSGWSVPSTPVEWRVEQARWLGDLSPRIHVAGWGHVPDNAPTTAILACSDGDELLAELPLHDRPDVQTHFRGSAGSLQSGFRGLIGLPESEPDFWLVLLDGDGRQLPLQKIMPGRLPGRGPVIHRYATWAARHDPDPPAPAHPIQGPRFSILLPVYRTDPVFLRDCITSVLAQHYTLWELVVVDDGSNSAQLSALLQSLAAVDQRIHLHLNPANGGISRATNDALKRATGDFVIMLDHDDRLRPHALVEFARRLKQDPRLDVLYSDEEKISPSGERVLPFLKPGFSPEFLRGVMYVGHALCVRTAVARAVDGFDPAFDGVQDFEFALRVTEHGARFAHVPRILYQWRQSASSSALHGNIKGDMDRLQAAAVQAHLDRRGDQRRAVPMGGHRVRLVPLSAPTWELVQYPVDADPTGLLRSAAATSTADILILLPRAAEDGDTPWLQQVAAVAALSDTGCVGPVLVDAENQVIASGMTVGSEGLQPLMQGYDATGDGYNGSLCCNREVAAIPMVGAAVRRRVLLEIGKEEKVGWHDFCASLRAHGLFNRVCASARLPCYTRLVAMPIAAPADADPYYNPHFTRQAKSHYLARTPAHLQNVAPQTVAYFDERPPEFLPGGHAVLRGWCFRRDGGPVTLKVRDAHLCREVRCDEPRPDVARAHPAGLSDGLCGFALHLRLSAGVHRLIVEACSPGQSTERISSLRVAVPPCPELHRWLWSEPHERIRRQLMAAAACAPQLLNHERFPVATLADKLPKLALVVPSYQQGRFLGENLQSILSGAQPQVALVVQDGGSTDASADVIRKHAHHMHAWESAPDHGQADAIAKGFAKTTGGPDDVMAWINSDDFYLPGALGYVADYFARHPEVDVIYGHRILVDENSMEIGRWFLPKHNPEVLRLNDFVPQETLFWRRRIWDKVGGIDPSFRFAMDWDLLLRFQAAGAKIVRVPYFLACFRIHPAQKTSAQMHSVGQQEIDRLRERTFGRRISPEELASNPRLIRYLRKSAFIEFLWKFGLRAP